MTLARLQRSIVSKGIVSWAPTNEEPKHKYSTLHIGATYGRYDVDSQTVGLRDSILQVLEHSLQRFGFFSSNCTLSKYPALSHTI